MNLDKAIKIFADYLNASWHIVYPLLMDRFYTTDEGSINDWLQANWEILVEKKVLKQNDYLEIYGEGADFFGASSRMTDIEALPTFVVKIIINEAIVKDILNNEIISKAEFSFDKLVGFKNGFYTNEPPFNYVLIQDDDEGIERVFPLDITIFELQKI